MRVSVLCAAAFVCAAASAPQITLEDGRFVLRGWQEAASASPDEWRRRFAVRVADAAAQPAMLGSYRVDRGALIFEPRFPVEPGVKYRASFGGNSAVLELPAERREAPRLLGIFPSASRLPENQLKIYLQFSAPMSRGAVYRHVSLWRENREAVELPFLEIDQELWNRAGTRLTLLFDPGRIKRGLVPNREAGPPLEPGVHYRLQIATGWPDARGAPLVQIYCKDFVVVAADRDPPDPARWKIHAPRAGTRDPLSVEFPEPMDRALLDTMLFVEKTEGDITVDRDETRWQFTPREPWSAGEHGLNFDTALEDLAGNRIGRLFDVDVFERVDRRIRREIRSLRFRIE